MRSAHRSAAHARSITAIICLSAAASILTAGASGQSAAEKAVEVSAVVQKSPPQVTLNWPVHPHATSYSIHRKAVDATAWGEAVASLPGAATAYVDTDISPGVRYEYQVRRNTSLYGAADGYITVGIEVPLVEYRGKVVLIVDRTYAPALAAELSRLERDLVGDGWTVLRRDVARDAPVSGVKALIRAEYESDPAQLKAVFLFGKVPVPYSGNIVPDGHLAHAGAWPADVFYGDMDGVWTDEQDLTAFTTGPQSNRRGDGKFDQNDVPGAVELRVGRVDLSDMPAFAPMTELELLRQYLDKNHNFRHRIIGAERRALIDDNFGYFGGEAFAATGWRNFATFFGAANVEEGDWFSTTPARTYLWAYGCGAGSYTGADGIGSTRDFAAADPGAVFTMLFGSWFGDWDTPDNLLRAPLATKTYGLTSAWAGRPHWFIHHMALGATIGDATRLTQNARPSLYAASGSGSIHVALMGDPTLRMHAVAPPSNLSAALTPATGAVALRWTAAPENVLGYNIYRAAAPSGPFSRVNTALIEGTTFDDGGAPAGALTYMVRAVKLESTASGTYFNASQGATVTLASHRINGRVTDEGGALRGVTVALGGSRLSTTQTDQNGSYSFDGLRAGGTYTVTPLMAGYTFEPRSRTFSDLSDEQTADFNAARGPAPALMVEADSARAISFDSVTHVRDPFPVVSLNNFSADRRTRVAVFASNLNLLPGEGVTVRAEDSRNRTYTLPVEFVGTVPGFEWLTQVIVKLPDDLTGAGDVWVSVSLRGATSNRALINIR